MTAIDNDISSDKSCELPKLALLYTRHVYLFTGRTVQKSEPKVNALGSEQSPSSSSPTDFFTLAHRTANQRHRTSPQPMPLLLHNPFSK